MLAAMAKAFAQLSDPGVRRMLKWGVLGTAAAYALLVFVAWQALSATTLFGAGWAETGFDIAAMLAAAMLPVLFFPALVTAFMGPWLDKVADAVEARHYPHLNWPRPQSWGEIMGTTLKFLAISALVNLAALPIYGLLLVTGISVPLALAVNGYLLGREYFELAAFRRLDPQAARTLFRNRLGRLWLAGTAIALLFSVPILNLAAPVIGAAFMVHVFHGLRPEDARV